MMTSQELLAKNDIDMFVAGFEFGPDDLSFYLESNLPDNLKTMINKIIEIQQSGKQLNYIQRMMILSERK